MKTAEQIAESLWEKHRQWSGVIVKDDFLAALHEYGEAVRDRAAGVCRDVTMDYFSDHHYKGWLDGRDKCAAAIERMELP